MDELKDLQEHLDAMMHDFNNMGQIDFEGYSPNEMTTVFYKLFDSDSVVRLRKPSSQSIYAKIPLFMLSKYLLNHIGQEGKIKLTKTGNLNTKIVAELYAQGYYEEEFIKRGISKLYKETDSFSIHLTKILLELSGLTKKRHGYLSLTKKGEKTIKDDFSLLKTLINTHCKKFNWGYFDGYESEQIGQYGIGFSIILLNKYGSKTRKAKYYADKYFTAYPMLGESLYRSDLACYTIRSFNRFLGCYGMLSISGTGYKVNDPIYVSTTEVFKNIFEIRKPKNPPKIDA